MTQPQMTEEQTAFEEFLGDLLQAAIPRLLGEHVCRYDAYVDTRYAYDVAYASAYTASEKKTGKEKEEAATLVTAAHRAARDKALVRANAVRALITLRTGALSDPTEGGG